MPAQKLANFRTVLSYFPPVLHRWYCRLGKNNNLVLCDLWHLYFLLKGLSIRFPTVSESICKRTLCFKPIDCGLCETASDWLAARLRYTRCCGTSSHFAHRLNVRHHRLSVRSAAVMSMVGFVLGLGDRHSENMARTSFLVCLLVIDHANDSFDSCLMCRTVTSFTSIWTASFRRVRTVLFG